MSDSKTESKVAPAPNGELEWEADVPVATHLLMLLNFGKVIILASSLMGALLAFLLAMTGDYSAILPLMGMFAACGAGLFLLMVAVSLVFYRNRMHMLFRVNASGASASVVDRRAKIASNVAIVAGSLANNPGVAGAGMISAATSDQNIPWEDIVSTRFRPRWRTISLANSWRTVLILFCRDDNYDVVATAVRTAVEARIADQPARKSPLPSLLLRSAMAVIATMPLFLLLQQFRVELFAPLLALCFALATIWFLPVFAWVVIATLAHVSVTALHAALAHSRGLRGDDWAILVLALFGAGYLLWLSIAALRGKIQPALTSN